MEVEERRKELHDDRIVDRGTLVKVEVGADEEDFVEEAEREEHVLSLAKDLGCLKCPAHLVVVVQPENARDVRCNLLVADRSGNEGADDEL